MRELPRKTHEFSRPAISEEVGSCIYCGNSDHLSDEHIVPRSLGGCMILRKASCDCCANVIKKFEQTCARNMFGAIRIKRNFPTRRKSERPSKISLERRSDDGSITVSDVDICDYPEVLFFMRFKHRAGLLLGDPSNHKSEIEGWVSCCRGTNLKAGDRPGVFDAYAYARLIAKIGLGLSVFHHGNQGLLPETIDFVLGKHNDLARVVGGELRGSPPTEALHTVDLDDKIDLSTMSQYITARIRLFSAMGAPTYHAVVAKRAVGSIGNGIGFS